jgi:Mg2+/Co2+ transporter CorB
VFSNTINEEFQYHRNDDDNQTITGIIFNKSKEF